MSGTTPTPTPTPTEPFWAKPSVGVFALGVYVVAFAAAYFSKSDTMLTALSATAATNATGVINYYFGSSSGSTRKTELAAPPPPATGA